MVGCCVGSPVFASDADIVDATVGPLPGLLLLVVAVGCSSGVDWGVVGADDSSVEAAVGPQ